MRRAGFRFQAPGLRLILTMLVLIAAGGRWRPAHGLAQLPTGTPTYNVNAKWVTDRGSQVFNVKAYGAVCNGTTDDTAAIQAAENAAMPSPSTNYPSANTVVIPGGCAISSTVTIYGILQGTGIGTPTGGGSYLKWIGPSGSPMVLVTTHGVSIRDLHFIGNSTNPPSEAIQLSTYPNTSTAYADQGSIRNIYIGYAGGGDPGGNEFTNGITWNGTAGGDSFWLSDIHVVGCTGNGVNDPNPNASNMHIENLYVSNCGVGWYGSGQSIYGTNWEFGGNGIDLELLNAADLNLKGFVDTAGYAVNTQMVVNTGGRLVIDGGSFMPPISSSNINIIDNSAGGAGYVILKNFNFLSSSSYTGTWSILACPTGGSGQQSTLRLVNTAGVAPSAISCPANPSIVGGLIDYEPKDGWGNYHTDGLNIISSFTGHTFDWTRHDSEHQYYFWGGPIELVQAPGQLITAGCAPTGSGSTSYGYRITGVTPQTFGPSQFSGAVQIGGETAPNTEVTCSNASSLSGTNYNTVSLYPIPGVSSYNIYCRTPGAELLCGNVPAVYEAAGQMTWVDNGSVTPSGAMPTANTTGRLVGGSENSGYSWTENLDIGADGHGWFSSLRDTGLISASALATDSSGNLISTTAGSVSSVTGSTGATVSPTTGAVVVSVNCDPLNMTVLCLNEEFPSAAGSYNWSTTAITGSAGDTAVLSGTNYITYLGTIYMTSGTVSGYGLWYQMKNWQPYLGATAGWDSHFYFQGNVTGTNGAYRVGYATSGATSNIPTNGIYVRYDGSLETPDTAVMACYNASSTETCATTGLAPNAQYDVRIRNISASPAELGITVGTASEITFCAAGCTRTVTPTNVHLSPSFEDMTNTTANQYLDAYAWHFYASGLSR